MSVTKLKHRIRQVIRSAIPLPILLWRQDRQEERGRELEWGLVRYLCKPDKDSIDIGANRGVYTLAMRKHSRLVHAFEPLPNLAKALVRRFVSGVSVHNVALSNKAGEGTLYVPIVGGAEYDGLASLTQTALLENFEHRILKVPVRKLDDVYEGDVGFIKIDVEGHEEAVLKGSRQTLVRCRPRLLIEIEERHAPGSTKRIPKFLARLGYQGFFCHARRLRPIQEFDPKVHQNTINAPRFIGIQRRQAFSEYINNFLFFPIAETQNLAHQIGQSLACRR
jgi:FkbM family methyltransferase